MNKTNRQKKDIKKFLENKIKRKVDIKNEFIITFFRRPNLFYFR